MIRFYFLLLFALSTYTLFAQGDGDHLFDDTALHEIRFTSVDTSFYLATKDYQPVGMTFDGEAVDSIGLKRKGNISGYPETNKFPFKVKTNKYVRGREYDGIREFMLHMNYQDPTMLREKLTYDICAEMGLYSLRTAFARVYIDDIYWGLYTIVEGKDEMYKQVFDNRDADAMENNEFGGMCYQGPNQSDYYVEFAELYGYDNDNGENDRAWSRFITMLDKVNNSANEGYVDTVSNYLNIEDFFRYQAVNVYLLNHDSYITFTGNQRYVYDTLETRWQVTPWDFNASFGLWNTNNNTVTNYPYLPDFGCIGNKITQIPDLQTIYNQAMCELNTTVLDTTRLYARIDELSAQIRDAVYEDNRKVINNQDFENGLNFGYFLLFADDQPALKTVVRERSRVIAAGLADQAFTCSPNSTETTLSYAEDGITAYPNPVGDVLYFTARHPLPEGTPVTITDATGRRVMNTSVRNGTVRVSSLSAGLYVCVLKTPQGAAVTKIVKQ